MLFLSDISGNITFPGRYLECYIMLLLSFQESLPLMCDGNQDNDFDRLCSPEFLLTVFSCFYFHALILMFYLTSNRVKYCIDVVDVYCFFIKLDGGQP